MMSKYFDENIVKSSVLFNRSPVDELNDILRKKHRLLFFEYNWQPRQYIENESPRCIFMIALFNACFLFHEAAPMSTESFNTFWEGNITTNLKSICVLRNIFAHNYIKKYAHLNQLKKFVKDIDAELPIKLDKSYNDNREHYLFSLPKTNEFWGKALEKICKMSNDILDNCKNTIENANNIEKRYIECYKKYILVYFKNNYRNEYKSEEKFKEYTEKIDSHMHDGFLTEWQEEDIYPETICEIFLDL